MWSSKKKESVKNAQEGPSTKEEILSTLENFGDTARSEKENNNHKQHDRQQSDSSLDDWEKPDPPSASFSNSYSAEWEKLFKRKNYRRQLRSYAMSGNLRSSRFRSVCWKMFLDVLPEDIQQWKNSCRKSRGNYTDLKDTLIINPRKAMDPSTSDLVVNNPLSQAEESPWNQFFLDNELRLTIKQDVIRTFPEVAFFQKADIQEMMINILFCFCKTNTELSYKQGMHELLAPLIFVLHCDHQAFLHAAEVETLEDIVKEIMDPAYLEHDAYALLSQIMGTVEPWYNSKDLTYNKSRERLNSVPFARPQDLNSSSAIVAKLTRIQDYILKKFDVELHGHLERLEIAPQIYGIRWIRLLFGREFPMQDLLALWDALFADGVGFELVDFVFVAMLLYIRDLLLSSDYPQCLTCLMRFPPVADINYLVEKAQYLREPNHFPRPPIYTYNTVNNIKSPAAQKPPPQSSSRTPQYPQQKRGSSASLSKVEDTVFKQTPSPSSMARLETTNDRFSNASVFTPEESPGNVAKFSTLPNMKAKGKKFAKQFAEYEHRFSELQGQLNEKESMSLYCANKLDVHISRLQTEILQQTLENEDELLIAIAGIKQVRDVLKGTLRFSQVEEEDMKIKNNYYGSENYSSPEANHQDSGKQTTESLSKKGRIFYMSSEENSENAESPTEGPTPVLTSRKGSFKKEAPLPQEDARDYELSDSVPQGGRKTAASGIQNQTVDVTEKTHPLETSPNPLYDFNCSVDSV
ncbi:TBC1 domain family member 5-like isoform X7 [Ostrea edulis]|uniref:TBC1 domain family member 5-like isoform X7 n=1 Tax=Ostrea edulis TaxID=37623 RepID=UPI0024AFCB24|nr:TBC1 domain family member 5-like isoform X7 [Ostrea edulis]